MQPTCLRINNWKQTTYHKTSQTSLGLDQRANMFECIRTSFLIGKKLITSKYETNNRPNQRSQLCSPIEAQTLFKLVTIDRPDQRIRSSFHLAQRYLLIIIQKSKSLLDTHTQLFLFVYRPSFRSYSCVQCTRATVRTLKPKNLEKT